jgi:hypothetical protein
MKTSLLLTACLLLMATAHAQHHHVNAGIIDANGNGKPDIGEQLDFVNRASYNTASGFVLELTAKSSGRYAGTFSGNITFAALAAGPDVGGPEPGHAALGTKIVMQLVSVSGPAGATFSFWESNGSSAAISLGTGQIPGMPQLWDLSENDGLPGDDPYGHIHNRQFSVDQPGTYIATFRLIDVSTNGPGGSSIHTPSEPFQMKFVAVPEPATWVLLGAALTLMIVRSGLRQAQRR